MSFKEIINYLYSTAILFLVSNKISYKFQIGFFVFIIYLFLFSRKNVCTNNQMIQIFNNISATLKIGKSNICMLIKSLTPPSQILSIKLPNVPAKKNAIGIRKICFWVYIRYIPIMMMMVMMMVTMMGTGRDRAIPVLNAGVIRKCVKIFWS